MDVRQFNKNRGAVSKKSSGAVPKGNPNPKGMKTFSGGFSKTDQQSSFVRKNSDFGIWTDQMSAQVGKEKVLLERKQEHKRRIAIEAIKLAEQRKREIMMRNCSNENDVQFHVPPKVKPELQNTTRRALFCLDVNQPGKSKSSWLPSVAPKLPSIKEIEPYLGMEPPKGRPILKAKPFSDRNSNMKSNIYQPPIDLMKGLKIEEPKRKKWFRYTADELMEMNPLKGNLKSKDIQK